jgi:hypothetical protein
MNSNEAEVMSPCVKQCKISSDSGLCVGCLRTIDEITVWSKADRSLKVAILEKIETRKLNKFTVAS